MQTYVCVYVHVHSDMQIKSTKRYSQKALCITHPPWHDIFLASPVLFFITSRIPFGRDSNQRLLKSKSSLFFLQTLSQPRTLSFFQLSFFHKSMTNKKHQLDYEKEHDIFGRIRDSSPESEDGRARRAHRAMAAQNLSCCCLQNQTSFRYSIEYYCERRYLLLHLRSISDKERAAY